MIDAERIVIPRCIGCGAMYEPERCTHGCREERLEVVAAGEFEALDRAKRSALARIESVLPVLGELSAAAPAGGDWQRAYRALARAARAALHDAALPATASADGTGAERLSVWRCPRCGAVDAPQECLGICIWRRFEWVAVADYDACRGELEAARELDRRVMGLLSRLAFATPRPGAWERSWRALGQEADILIARHAQAGERSGAHV